MVKKMVTTSRASRFHSGVKTAATVASAAYTALKIAKGVASLVNAEKKTYDDFYTPATLTTGFPMLRHVSSIAQGTAVDQRDGNSVSLKSFQSNFYVDWNNSGTQIRRILFIDKNSNGGNVPTIADLLEVSSSPVYQMISPINKVNFRRFKILADERLNEDMSVPHAMRKMYKKFGGSYKGKPYDHHLTFKGPLGSDSESGHIYELIMCNGGSTNFPSISATNRIRYYDN